MRTEGLVGLAVSTGTRSAGPAAGSGLAAYSIRQPMTDDETRALEKRRREIAEAVELAALTGESVIVHAAYCPGPGLDCICWPVVVEAKKALG